MYEHTRDSNINLWPRACLDTSNVSGLWHGRMFLATHIGALSRLSLSINIGDRIAASAIDNSRLFYFRSVDVCEMRLIARHQRGITPRAASH